MTELYIWKNTINNRNVLERENCFREKIINKATVDRLDIRVTV